MEVPAEVRATLWSSPTPAAFWRCPRSCWRIDAILLIRGAGGSATNNHRKSAFSVERLKDVLREPRAGTPCDADECVRLRAFPSASTASGAFGGFIAISRMIADFGDFIKPRHDRYGGHSRVSFD